MISSPSNSKHRRIMLAILAVIAVIGLAALAWFNSIPGSKKVNQVTCNAETRKCFDGSSVGRVGPNCDFAACPIPTERATTTPPVNAEPLNYDEFVPDAYKDGANWPPYVSSESGKLSCDDTKGDNPDQVTVKKTIGGREYCITVLYDISNDNFSNVSYSYRTQIGDNIGLVSFSLHYPKCENYEDEQKAECDAQRQKFNPEVVAESIVKDLK